jgi:LacI family transcriptional regulator
VDEALVRLGPYDEAHGRQFTHELLDLPDRPTAIFVTSDAAVLGALQAIAERGLRVPQDVSVVSFDDFIAAHMVPPLTAVAQPFDPLAAEAIRLLDAQLGAAGGAVAQHLRLPPALVTRASCGPPPPHRARA